MEKEYNSDEHNSSLLSQKGSSCDMEEIKKLEYSYEELKFFEIAMKLI